VLKCNKQHSDTISSTSTYGCIAICKIFSKRPVLFFTTAAVSLISVLEPAAVPGEEACGKRKIEKRIIHWE
tara:strand:+ start:876 stop:1088 length:213 start_codon:yes stop_codon:yes gene_type:complete